MSPKELPDEVWQIIIDYLKRPKPRSGSLVTRRNIHHQDLTSLMRLDTRVHDLAGTHLYHSVISSDILHLTLGWQSNTGKTTGGGMRKTKLELLKGVKKLYIVGGLCPGKVDPVGRLLADLPYDHDDFPRTHRLDDIIHLAFDKQLKEAFASRSARLTRIAPANIFQSLDCLAINAYEYHIQIPAQLVALLQKRYDIEGLLIEQLTRTTMFQPTHICLKPFGPVKQYLRLDERLKSWPVRFGYHRLSTARFHYDDVSELPDKLVQGVTHILGPVTATDNMYLQMSFNHLADLLAKSRSLLESSSIARHHDFEGGHPSVILIVECRAMDMGCLSLRTNHRLNGISLDEIRAKSLSYASFAACQRIWSEEAKHRDIPINAIQITTDLNAAPCAACESVGLPNKRLQADYPTEEAMEAFKAELRECQDEFERSHREERND